MKPTEDKEAFEQVADIVQLACGSKRKQMRHFVHAEDILKVLDRLGYTRNTGDELKA